MKIAIARVIPDFILENELTLDYIVPNTLNKGVHAAVAKFAHKAVVAQFY
jgi:hypothetical protein